MAVKTTNKILLADAILLLPLDEPAAKNGTAAPAPHGSLVL
jgi:hypothetical protein